MKRACRILFLCTAIAIAGICEPHPVQGAETDIRLVSADEYGLTLELQTPPFTVEKIQGPQRLRDDPCCRLHVPGWAATQTPSTPELPLTGTLIQVPSSGKITLEVLENDQETLGGFDICPVAQPPQIEISERNKPPIQETRAEHLSGFFPETLVELSPRYIMRTATVSRIMFHPFQWNAATGELRVSRTIRVRVHFANPLAPDSRAMFSRKGPVPDEPMTSLLRHSIINYGERENNASSFTFHSPPATRGLQESGVSQATGKCLGIEVKQEAIYQLSYDSLLAAGVPVQTLNPGTFRLLNMGKEAAIRVVSKLKNHFNQGDYIEFYGREISTAFTDTNVYWLYWGKTAGKRMATRSARVTGAGQYVDSFYEVLRVEQNIEIWHNTPGAPGQDYWFWEKITAPAAKSYTVHIPSPIADKGDAVVRVCFRGRTTASTRPNHHTRITLNGTPVGDECWSDDAENIQEMQVPASTLSEGDNNLAVELPGDTGVSADIAYLNWIEIGYRRSIEAVDDQLVFTVEGEGSKQVEVSGLSRPKTHIYDVTAPFNVKRLTGFQVAREGSGYRTVFEDNQPGKKRYYVFDNKRPRSPDHIELWRPVNLKDSGNGADYILITARDFLDSVKPLLRFRRSQGLRAMAVAVEDIYNVFSHGLVNPKAIKDFLRYAYETWERPAPTYVFLLGDANTDYRGYLGTTKKTNRVPAHLSATQSLRLTPDDNWFVAVEGKDLLPDMLIGRMPASSAQTAAEAVDKILRYEQASDYRPRRALFAADNNELSFETINEELIGYLPSDFDTRRVYLRSYTNVDAATKDIIAGMDEGMLITNYVGHGDVVTWAGEKVFNSDKVASLNNPDRLTFAIAFDCLNAYFADTSRYSLGEELVKAANGGAIGFFSQSSMGLPWEHDILGKKLFSSIFKQGNDLLGVVATQSKIDALAGGATKDLMRSFVLLGDPAVRLKR